MESSNQKIILYIEDNEANRQLVQFLLERKGNLTLLLAADGKSGLESARQKRPDLILLDITLPDMNGYDLLACLKEDPATRDIPVVAVSGDHPRHLSGDGQISFAGYLTKPISVGPLYLAIDKALANR